MQTPPPSFAGFSAQPKPVETPQQGQMPAQKDPTFMFGKTPEHQRAAAGGPAAQQQPDLGSARAQGFTFTFTGSQNVPPTQNSARPFKVRSARTAAKGATPRPTAAPAQDAPTYTQPGPRMSIPVRCSNHFEGSTQGAACQFTKPASWCTSSKC